MSRKEPNRNVYVGHRYVPLILEEWDKKISYEGLSVVTHKGGSYTSKKRVPVGIDILNKEFWSLTGNYNAQVEYYREETERVSDALEEKADLSEMNQFREDTNSDINQFKTATNNDISQFKSDTNSDIKQFKSDTDSDISQFKTDTDSNISQLRTDTESDINDLSTNTNERFNDVEKSVDNQVYNVLSFGAVGDSITDDTNSIKNAVIEAEENNGTLLFPKGYEFLTSDTIDFGNTINVIMDSPIILDSESPVTSIIYGNKDERALHKKSKFWTLNKNISDWSDYSVDYAGNNTYTGIKIINIGMSDLEIVQSNNFTTGVEFLAHRSGLYFNKIKLGQIRNNRSGVQIISENGGWPNGNDFFGGEFSIGGSVNPNISRTFIRYHKRSGTYYSNSNSFSYPKFEGGIDVTGGAECIPIMLDSVKEYYFNNIRGENFVTNRVSKFIGDARDNTIIFRAAIMRDDIIRIDESENTVTVHTGSGNNLYILHYKERDLQRVLDKKPIFDTGQLSNAIIYNKNNSAMPSISKNMLFYSIASTEFREGTVKTSSGGAVNPNFDESGGVKFSSSSTPGVKIDTTNCKDFLIENSENEVNYVIVAFDSDDNLITGEIPVNHGFYNRNWYNIPDNIRRVNSSYFTVNDNVSSIIIMVTSYTKRWRLYGLNGSTHVIAPSEKIVDSFKMVDVGNNIYNVSISDNGELNLNKME